MCQTTLVEEALYDIPSIHDFAGIDLGREATPDETTICKFRHLLESKNLSARLFHLVNGYLQEHDWFASKGTIMNATSPPAHSPNAYPNIAKTA